MWWMFDTDQCLPFGLPSWFDLYEKRKKAKKNEEVVFDKWKRLRSCKYTFSSEYFLYWEIRFDWIRWCSTNRSRKEIFTSKKLFCMIFFFFFFFFLVIFVYVLYWKLAVLLLGLTIFVPQLLYGLDIVKMSTSELTHLDRQEGSCLKSLLSLSNYGKN